MSHHRVDAISGQLPQRVILGLVSNKDYNGDMKTTPFNFQHFNTVGVQLVVNGTGVPTRRFEPVWSDKNAGVQVAREYASLFQATHKMNTDSGLPISYKWYQKGGYCLYAFSLSTHDSDGINFFGMIQNGSVNVELQFNTALAETVSCILYAEYANILEINEDMMASFDYKA